MSALTTASMTQTGSSLLLTLGWVALGAAIACAATIAWDVFVRGYRQHMAVMNAVFPITALYWGPVALWFYWRRGRRISHKWAREHDVDMDELMARDDDWWATAKGTSHCGAGCTLGDICGEWIVYLTAWMIALFGTEAANSLTAMYVADFVLAWTFGIVFQYFSIVPMRKNVGRLEGVWLAIKADTLSIVAFQVGLFGWMALYHLVFWKPPLTVASPGYWMMMQVGMIIGFFTSWPVNVWLIRRGWKEKM